MTHRVRLRGAFVLLVLTMPSASDAQSLPVTSPDGRRALAAARADGPIVVDGVLDEPIWRTAVPATGFVQSAPIEGQPASEEFFLENSGICYFGDIPRNQRQTTRFPPPEEEADKGRPGQNDAVVRTPRDILDNANVGAIVLARQPSGGSEDFNRVAGAGKASIGWEDSKTRLQYSLMGVGAGFRDDRGLCAALTWCATSWTRTRRRSCARRRCAVSTSASSSRTPARSSTTTRRATL